MKKTATKTVMEIGEINFEGNIIPHSWYRFIRYKNDRVHLPAIIVLADLIYWYRPTIVEDESHNIVEYRKKFKSDKFQCSLRRLTTKYGLTKQQADTAIRRLVELKLITKETRAVTLKNGIIIPQAMFLEPIPAAIKKISFSYTEEKDNQDSSFSSVDDNPSSVDDNPSSVDDNPSSVDEINGDYIRRLQTEITNKDNSFSSQKKELPSSLNFQFNDSEKLLFKYINESTEDSIGFPNESTRARFAKEAARLDCFLPDALESAAVAIQKSGKTAAIHDFLSYIKKWRLTPDDVRRNLHRVKILEISDVTIKTGATGNPYDYDAKVKFTTGTVVNFSEIELGSSSLSTAQNEEIKQAVKRAYSDGIAMIIRPR